MTAHQNRIIIIKEHKTSMRLTTPEWHILDRICIRENIKREQLLNLIDDSRAKSFGLTPAVRLFSLLYLHNLAKCAQNYAYAPDSTTLHDTLKEIAE